MNYFGNLDLQLLSKITSYVPISSIRSFKLVCKIFSVAVLEHYKEICSNLVKGAPNCSNPIESDEVLDCMYQLYDIHFHGIITAYMYDAYKARLGLNDIYLFRFYGDRFMAHPQNVPLYQFPRSARFRYVQLGEDEVLTRVFPISLCNFNVLQRTNPQEFNEKDVLLGLRNISENLQCKLVEEMPARTFDIETLLQHRISLPVMRSFGYRVGRSRHLSDSFSSDHMYLRTLIPFFAVYGLNLYPLFFLMQRSLSRPVFGRPYNLDPEACTSIAMAIHQLGFKESYKHHFAKEDRKKIKARIEELEREYSSKLTNAKKRDASPERK